MRYLWEQFKKSNLFNFYAWRDSWPRLLAFTVITTIALAFSSWLLPNGRIYQHNVQAHTALIRKDNATKRHLQPITAQIDQLQKRQAVLEPAIKAEPTGITDAQRKQRDALASDCKSVQTGLDKLDQSVQAVQDQQDRLNHVMKFATNALF